MAEFGVSSAIMLMFLAAFALCGLDSVGQMEVRLEGYLNAPRKEVRAWQELVIRVGDGPLQAFAMTDVTVLSAGPVMGASVVEQVEMIKPNFIFAGDEPQLERIATAQPNQLLKITGYTNFGSQFVLVSTVERSEPITGPTPTPSLRKRLLEF
jgi:hypothetical protein